MTVIDHRAGPYDRHQWREVTVVSNPHAWPEIVTHHYSGAHGMDHSYSEVSCARCGRHFLHSEDCPFEDEYDDILRSIALHRFGLCALDRDWCAPRIPAPRSDPPGDEPF